MGLFFYYLIYFPLIDLFLIPQISYLIFIIRNFTCIMMFLVLIFYLNSIRLLHLYFNLVKIWEEEIDPDFPWSLIESFSWIFLLCLREGFLRKMPRFHWPGLINSFWERLYFQLLLSPYSNLRKLRKNLINNNNSFIEIKPKYNPISRYCIVKLDYSL